MKPALAVSALLLALATDAGATLPYAEARILPRVLVAIAADLTLCVRDTDGRAVPGAWVLIDRDGTRKGSVSDAAGRVRLPGVLPGMYRLVVRSDGSAPYSTMVECQAALPVDVRLMPASGEAGW